jgi:hypothetical protein
MTGSTDWGLVKTPDGVGITGVYSRSEEAPLKTANFRPDDKAFEGAAKYSDWKFQYSPINVLSPYALPRQSGDPLKGSNPAAPVPNAGAGPSGV